MKYYSFKLDWTNPKEGTNPSVIINNSTTRFEPDFFVGNEPDSIHYGYLLSGEIDTTELTKWSMTEITLDDMLLAAQIINPNAYIDNGKILYPSDPTFLLP
jgi:hypothetical protein